MYTPDADFFCLFDFGFASSRCSEFLDLAVVFLWPMHGCARLHNGENIM
jgi:hypothetical protein